MLPWRWVWGTVLASWDRKQENTKRAWKKRNHLLLYTFVLCAVGTTYMLYYLFETCGVSKNPLNRGKSIAEGSSPSFVWRRSSMWQIPVESYAPKQVTWLGPAAQRRSGTFTRWKLPLCSKRFDCVCPLNAVVLGFVREVRSDTSMKTNRSSWGRSFEPSANSMCLRHNVFTILFNRIQ